MTVDLDKMIEGISEMSGDSMECRLRYRKDGETYFVKLVVERIDEEVDQCDYQ